jgi:hypothetical protein
MREEEEEEKEETEEAEEEEEELWCRRETRWDCSKLAMW